WPAGSRPAQQGRNQGPGRRQRPGRSQQLRVEAKERTGATTISSRQEGDDIDAITLALTRGHTSGLEGSRRGTRRALALLSTHPVEAEGESFPPIRGMRPDGWRHRICPPRSRPGVFAANVISGGWNW